MIDQSGLNSFGRLMSLLKTRRETIQSLTDQYDNACDKVTAWHVLNQTRVIYDKAVVRLCKEIVDAYEAEGFACDKKED